jgi:hypothetical protein
MNATIGLHQRKIKGSYKDFMNIESVDSFNRFFQIEKVRNYKKLIGISKILRQTFVLYWSNTEKKV